MSDSIEIQAEVRADEGKGASRRLRRLEGKTPGVIYGGNQPATSISLIRKDLEKNLESESFYTALLSVRVDGKAETAILKDVQRHPAKGFAMHVDFLRVEADKEITISIPLHFINEEKCKGVKMSGGMIQHQQTDIEVQCLPGNIPDYVEVDMLDLDIGDIIHLTDLRMPEGVVSTALALGEEHDLAIAAVIAPRAAKEADDEDAPAADDAGDSDDEGDKD